VLIEREIGHQALQARVLVPQLPQLVDLGQPELGVLLLPEVKARLSPRAVDRHPPPACRLPPGATHR
jgi:hypothetical protein